MEAPCLPGYKGAEIKLVVPGEFGIEIEPPRFSMVDWRRGGVDV